MRGNYVCKWKYLIIWLKKKKKICCLNQWIINKKKKQCYAIDYIISHEKKSQIRISSKTDQMNYFVSLNHGCKSKEFRTLSLLSYRIRKKNVGFSLWLIRFSQRGNEWWEYNYQFNLLWLFFRILNWLFLFF
jgi:hypothetical protein